MAQPLSPHRQAPASRAFVTDSNRPQPLWHPPPTACLTASGAASEVPSLRMQPCSGVAPARRVRSEDSAVENRMHAAVAVPCAVRHSPEGQVPCDACPEGSLPVIMPHCPPPRGQSAQRAPGPPLHMSLPPQMWRASALEGLAEGVQVPRPGTAAGHRSPGGRARVRPGGRAGGGRCCTGECLRHALLVRRVAPPKR